MFPGLEPQQLPDGQGPAIERVTITTHNGTHLDAPWHFHSTMDGGKPALTDRPGAARVVLLRRREARLPRQAGRLRVHRRRRQARARPHRLPPQAARHRAGEHGRRRRVRRAELHRQGLRHGAGGHAPPAQAEASRSPASTAGAGTRRSRSRASALPRPATPASSGRGTRRAARSVIATWRSSPTWISCRRSASRSAASRSRSRLPRRAGPAASPCWRAERALGAPRSWCLVVRLQGGSDGRE